MNASLANYRSLLEKYLRPERGRVGLLALLLAASIVLQLLSPQIIRYFIDSVGAGRPEPALILASLGFLAAGLVQRAAAMAMLYVGERVGWATTNALRADLTRHVLGLDMPFHKQHTPGELIQRLDGDVTALAQFFAQFVVRVAGNALLVAGILAVLFRENWRIGAVLAAYAGLTIFVLSQIQNVTSRRWVEERQSAAGTFGFLEERIAGTEDIRASGAEVYSLRRLEGLLGTWTKVMVRAQTTNAMTTGIANLLGLTGSALALALGGYFYIRGSITIGTAYLVVSYVSLLAAPLDELRSQAQGLGQAGASVSRILAIQAERSQLSGPTDAAQAAPLPAGPLAVEFANVSFAYNDPTTAPAANMRASDRSGQSDQFDPSGQSPTLTPSPNGFALHDLSFCLEPGRVLGILGRTGSGKTTLTRLLFRLYDPNAGAVRLAGAELPGLPVAEVRSRVGLVTQEVQLFQASVRDNLAFFDRRIGDTEIELALRTLGLWEWVERLPQGLDTPLLAGGQGLSAGEAQLLALGRVFLKDPGLVVLDEASSRLDPFTERLLENAIDRLLANRTGIIIAHRLRTVHRADDLLILESGRLVEHGARARLAADPESRFSRLLQAGLEEALA